MKLRDNDSEDRHQYKHGRDDLQKTANDQKKTVYKQ